MFIAFVAFLQAGLKLGQKMGLTELIKLSLWICPWIKVFNNNGRPINSPHASNAFVGKCVCVN
jgi:hypothetical protein